MKVIKDKVLFKPIIANKGKNNDGWDSTSGGILYRKEGTNEAPKGVVIAIGNLVKEVKVDDIIYYPNNTTDSFSFEGMNYKVIREKDILYKEEKI